MYFRILFYTHTHTHIYIYIYIYISIDRTVGWTLIAKSLSLFSFIHHLLEVSRSVAEMGSFGMLSRRTLGTDTPVMTQVLTSYSRIDSCLFSSSIYLVIVRNSVLVFAVQIRKLMAELTNPMSLAQVPFPLSLQFFFLFASRNLCVCVYFGFRECFYFCMDENCCVIIN